MFHCMPSPGPACRVSGFEDGPAGWGCPRVVVRSAGNLPAAVAGEISEYVAPLAVTKTRHLDARTGRDVEMAAVTPLLRSIRGTRSP